MKIYTKTGDLGETGLFGGPRVSKDHPRIEAYGTVDELNATLGMARCESTPQTVDLSELIQCVQNELFQIGAELATPDPEKSSVAKTSDGQIARLEAQIDAFEQELKPLRQFILPGGTRLSSTLHLSRTVCRRAERRVVQLQQLDGECVSWAVVRYLNRLSDLLFVMSRVANSRESVPDVAWNQEENTH